MFVMILDIAIIVCVVAHLFFDKKPRTAQHVVEVILLYILVIGIGIDGLISFAGHAFIPNLIAQQIGWPTGNPFQFEVAMADLSYGVLGILCIWWRKGFWVATGIGSSILYFGDGYGHIVQIVTNRDYAPYNTGAILYQDLLFPIIILALLIAYSLIQKHATSRQRIAHVRA